MALEPVNRRHLAQNLLGRSAVEAAGYALTFGFHLRVVQENGTNIRALGEDYDPKRWDIEVNNGIITGVRIPEPPAAAAHKSK